MDENRNSEEVKQQERVRPKLASVEELKGDSKENKKKAIKPIFALLILVVCLGILAGLYFGTDIFKTAETETTEETTTETVDTRVKLTDKTTADFKSATITGRDDGLVLTVKLNDKYVDESAVEETETEEAATEEAATEEAATEEAATEEVATEEVATEEAATEEAATEEAATEEAATEEAVEESLIHEVEPNQKYVFEGMPYFKVNSTNVSTIASYCVTITAQDTVAENSDNLAEFGLDEPRMIVDITYADDTTVQYRFGDLTPTEQYMYFQIAGDEHVYIVFKSVLTAFNRDLADLHEDSDIETIDASSVENILVEQEGKDTIEIGFETVDDTTLTVNSIVLKQPIYYGANSDRVQEIFDGEAALAVSCYAGHVSTNEELAEYGLYPAKKHIFAQSAETTDDDGNTSFTTMELWLGDTDGERTYAMIDDSGDIYYIENSLLTFVDNCRLMYLVDQFTNLINIKKVDSLDVVTPDNEYHMSVKREPYTDEDGEEKTNDTYYFDDVETDEDLFKDLYQVIIGRLYDKECADYDYDGQVVCSVTYHVNIEASDFTVEYLDYDKDYYAVRRDGKTYFLIRRSSIDGMLKNCEEYRNGEFTGDE